MRHSAGPLAVDDNGGVTSNTRRFIGKIRRDDDHGAALPERFNKTGERRTESKRCDDLVESHAPGFAGS